jgi:UDP-N-acetylglucosamine:LPS N-acetylglucosamine transferase
MADRGAGLLVRQADWQLAEVAQWLSEAAADPARLQAMSRSSRALARIEAAAAVVDELEGIAA